MSELTIKKLMEAMPGAFIPERAEGINAVTLFSFSGENGGDWTVTIRDQKIIVESGKPLEKPTLSLHGNAQDILDIFFGKLDPTKAFMQGKLRMKGNMGLAFKLAKLFRIDEELYRSVQK
ncbi:MAG TPA: SCP2 sterol-binding domain-containing protein [Longilinea sp.]|nr:SCP2 sterol-binding domain-containing protein [Longilinea sp.]